MYNTTSEPNSELLETVVINLIGANQIELHITPVYNQYGYIEMANSYAEIREIEPDTIFYKHIDCRDGVVSDIDSEGFIIIYPEFSCDIDSNGEPYNIFMGEAKRFKSSVLYLSTCIDFNDSSNDKIFKEAFNKLISLANLNCSYQLMSLKFFFDYHFTTKTLFPDLIYKIQPRNNLLLLGENLSLTTNTTKSGSIYIFANKERTRFKLGYSTNVKSRLRAITSASGFELDVIYIFKKTSIEIEKKIHFMFNLFAIKGEWYPYDESLISTITTAIKQLKSEKP